MNKKALDNNVAKLEATLDRVMTMEVCISEMDVDYTLEYIAEKLALVTAYCERLSSHSTLLSRHSIPIIRASKSAKALIRIKNAQFMNSTEYRSKLRGRQKPWLEAQLIPYYQASNNWDVLEKSVAIVQDAIAEKMSTFRKIDSALRLHTKIFEDKHGIGYGVPAANLRGDNDGLMCKDLT